jgi:hypothetical protein
MTLGTSGRGWPGTSGGPPGADVGPARSHGALQGAWWQLSRHSDDLITGVWDDLLQGRRSRAPFLPRRRTGKLKRVPRGNGEPSSQSPCFSSHANENERCGTRPCALGTRALF